MKLGERLRLAEADRVRAAAGPSSCSGPAACVEAMTELQAENEALRASVPTERVRVLRCPWGHVHLWPAEAEPIPDACMAKVASLPDVWPNCGKALHVSRDLVVGDAT